jgi:dephospho-CoA kinase
LGHEVLDLPEIQAAAAERWGRQIFGPAGKIDRRRLAQIVFQPTAAGAQELAYLEHLTHGPIRQRAEQQVAEMARRPEVRAIVIDAPLLIEAGWNEFCDKIVYVEAPREVRQARALTRGWNQEDFDRRERRQESLEVKSGLADVVIDNSGSAEQTRDQLERVWLSPLGLPPQAAD